MKEMEQFPLEFQMRVTLIFVTICFDDTAPVDNNRHMFLQSIEETFNMIVIYYMARCNELIIKFVEHT